MYAPPIELGPIRPVAEAGSLLIRTTRGCPWNKCEFCVNYKDMDFSIRPLEDILKDIEKAAEYYGGKQFKSCFLQDGDSFVMKTKDLLVILESIHRHFPGLERITSYGRAATMIRKTPDEMKEIQAAGLNRLYCGMESGSDAVLAMVKKGTTADDIVKAGCMAKDAGMEISEFVIMGLGGKRLWKQHAEETAAALNRIDPHFLRVRTIGVKIGGGLERMRMAGEFELQTEEEIIVEQRLLISGLDNITSYYSNDHSVNLLMEAEGQFPDDKQKLLDIMDRFLGMSRDDKDNFSLGRRLGMYRAMSDMKSGRMKEVVDAKQKDVQKRFPDQLDEILHGLREQVV